MFGSKMDRVNKAINKKQVSTLIDLCNDKDKEVCLAAITGLGSVGGDDTSNFLISHLQNSDSQVRIVIAQALGTLGDIHTKAFVSAQLSKEENPDVREALRKALGQIKNY